MAIELYNDTYFLTSSHTVNKTTDLPSLSIDATALQEHTPPLPPTPPGIQPPSSLPQPTSTSSDTFFHKFVASCDKLFFIKFTPDCTLRRGGIWLLLTWNLLVLPVLTTYLLILIGVYFKQDILLTKRKAMNALNGGQSGANIIGIPKLMLLSAFLFLLVLPILEIIRK